VTVETHIGVLFARALMYVDDKHAVTRVRPFDSGRVLTFIASPIRFGTLSFFRSVSNRFEFMAGPSAEDIIDAFAEAVRESLENGTPIEAPGLGHFDIEHRQSQMIETDDGEARMAPPRDVIKFRPDSS